MPTRTKSTHDISRIAWQLLLFGRPPGPLTNERACTLSSKFTFSVTCFIHRYLCLFHFILWPLGSSCVSAIAALLPPSPSQCLACISAALQIFTSPEHHNSHVIVTGTINITSSWVFSQIGATATAGIACQTSRSTLGRVWFGGAHPSFATLGTAGRPSFEYRHMMREVLVRMTIVGCECHCLRFGSTLRIWLLLVVCPSVGWSPLGLVLIEEVLL